RLHRTSSRRGRVWQEEYFDRIVRDVVELQEKAEYIGRNPWKRWPDLDSYRWVWVEDGEEAGQSACVPG
ncbi:MAG: hypothetical protein V1728_04900, partial [Candidatus Micrarchaeota archaeon]